MSIINSTLPAPAAIVQQPVADAPQTGTGIAADASGDTSGAQAPAAPAVELTPTQKLEKRIADLSARIVKDTEALEQAKTALANIGQSALIVPGAGVRAVIGRGETKREEVASVIAVEDGRVSIFFGAGLQSKTAVVRVEDIIEVVQAAPATA